jgi:hypothetical protein
METDLEKYLKKQRQALDVESPDDLSVWEGIRQELQRSSHTGARKAGWIRIRNIAAAAIIVFSTGYMFRDIIGDRRAAGEITLSSIDRELGAREKMYREVVGYKREEAGSFAYPENAVIVELIQEIQRLDTIYEETMRDLGELGYHERALETIFDTYERKIYLLELIILENNKIRNNETQENLLL